jgi:hypothetical protein
MAALSSTCSDLPKDEDIITVTSVEGGHKIWSLAETSSPSDSALNQLAVELRTSFASDLSQAFLEKHLLKALPAYLDPTKNEVHLLISTLSGTGLAPAFYDNIVHLVLDAIGLKESSYVVKRTSSADSVKEFAQSVLLTSAEKGRQQTVLLLSGDGGIVDIVNGLLESGERSTCVLRDACLGFILILLIVPTPGRLLFNYP